MFDRKYNPFSYLNQDNTMAAVTNNLIYKNACALYDAFREHIMKLNPASVNDCSLDKIVYFCYSIVNVTLFMANNRLNNVHIKNKYCKLFCIDLTFLCRKFVYVTLYISLLYSFMLEELWYCCCNNS